MKKAIRIVVVVVLALFILLALYAGPFVKKSLNTAAPALLGVPVSVQDIDVSLLQGLVRITGLVIGNPEGFTTDSLFAMQQLDVDVKMISLLTGSVVIKKIEIAGPEVTYDLGLTGSNIGAFLDQLSGGESETAPEETPAPVEKTDEAKSGKSVVIEKFILADGQINLSFPGMGGTSIPVPLPKVELSDIGKGEEGGTDAKGVVTEVFGAVFSSVESAVAASGKLPATATNALESIKHRVGPPGKR